jgi:hypothetical protein
MSTSQWAAGRQLRQYWLVGAPVELPQRMIDMCSGWGCSTAQSQHVQHACRGGRQGAGGSPVGSMHLLVWQPVASLHVLGVPMHLPARHLSLVVHALPSSQDLPLRWATRTHLPAGEGRARQPVGLRAGLLARGKSSGWTS